MWNELYAKTGKINLVIIYVSEAHASDGWALSKEYSIPQHKNIDDRIQAASNYINWKKLNYKTRIFVDNIELPNFEKTYSAWPERGFVFENGKIVYISYGTVDDQVRWGEGIDDWLRNKFK